MAIPLVERIIEDALKIVNDPNRWTQGADAKDAKGKPCRPFVRRAVRFCARGALIRAAHDLGTVSHFALVAMRLGAPDLVCINDGPDGRRKAITLLKKALKSHRA